MSETNANGFEPAKVLKTLPSMPGVYRYFDAAGTCLYVGKARDLKKRVSSYFHKNDLSPRIAIMVSQIARLEITVTANEAEALLLENNLIKTLSPKYNILFRDDKSYPYLKIGSGPFPRISYYRGSVDKVNHYFGPYPSAQSVKESIGLIQKIFRIRSCEDSVFKNRTRECLLGQIGRCSAPCVGKISQENYAKTLEDTERFLLGETDFVIADIQKRMFEASEALEFEKAAVLRDQMASLSNVLHQQSVETTGADTDADIVTIAQRDGVVCLTLAMVRGSRHLGDRPYFPKSVTSEAIDIEELIEAFISQHYDPESIPSVFICEEVDAARVKELFESVFEKKVNVVKHPQGVRRAWLEMGKTNAAMHLERHLEETLSKETRLKDLSRELGLTGENGDLNSIRIECFDISHMSGESTVASCVVFLEGKMQSHLYRRFNITTTDKGDDYAAMREAVARRYAPVARGEAKLPDVVLIDGGKGQIHVVRETFEEMGLDISVIVGVSKGDHRKVGLETLHFLDGREPLVLGRTSPALMLLAEVRDEAHRFAITGMRAKRDKTRRSSRIEEISGIGPRRRQKLLSFFGGIRGLKNASLEDIATISGISKNLAKQIYAALHEEI
ncbi:MAG TPA: excinuclease ABC subunit C [Sutterella sp.]|nr:excinuclease ABC subunit C [Sutterella sp.]